MNPLAFQLLSLQFELSMAMSSTLELDAMLKAVANVLLRNKLKKGDRVKINEGTFENFEGEVEQIDEANGRVTVMLSIFGRSTPVDIEYWQIETV